MFRFFNFFSLICHLLCKYLMVNAYFRHLIHVWNTQILSIYLIRCGNGVVSSFFERWYKILSIDVKLWCERCIQIRAYLLWSSLTTNEYWRSRRYWWKRLIRWKCILFIILNYRFVNFAAVFLTIDIFQIINLVTDYRLRFSLVLLFTYTLLLARSQGA